MIVKHVYIPLRKNYSSKQGLSERLIRRRLEKEQWVVWRGSSINILRYDELYPNVRRKYTLLYQLLEKYHPEKREFLEYLCAVHHGMPDFLCFRNGKFKFVECKLQYESLSKRQKKCIQKLQELGFVVEIHKIVDHRTKARVSEIDIQNGNKVLIDKQLTIRKAMM